MYYRDRAKVEQCWRYCRFLRGDENSSAKVSLHVDGVQKRGRQRIRFAGRVHILVCFVQTDDSTHVCLLLQE